MAHLLNYNQTQQRHAFFKAGSAPWHKLGKLVKDKLTSAEAIKEALLDFKVALEPIYIKINDQEVLLNNYKATRRTDLSTEKSVLGIVQKRYTVCQNEESFKIIDDIIGEQSAVIESAGALRNGETIFITAKLPEHIQIKDEPIDQYLVICNNHSGKYGLKILYTPICVVCNNTLQLANKKATRKLTIRHTKNMGMYLKDVAKALNVVDSLKKELEHLAQTLIEKKCTRIEQNDFIHFISHKAKSNPKKIADFLETQIFTLPDMDLEARQDTAWGMYQAVTAFYNHEKPYRSEDSRFSQIMFGQDYGIMLAAKEYLYELSSQ